MSNYICVTCGVQYQETDAPPEHCLICEDDRQYIGHKGQLWTTIPEMQKDHHNRIEDIEPNLTGIGTTPGFAIGPRALLVQTPQGNVLWDCVSLLDDATVEAVRSRGGISAIAVSHPHLSARLWSGATPSGTLRSIGTPITVTGSCGLTLLTSSGREKRFRFWTD